LRISFASTGLRILRGIVNIRRVIGLDHTS
jgi:hypothetical protein